MAIHRRVLGLCFFAYLGNIHTRPTRFIHFIRAPSCAQWTTRVETAPVQYAHIYIHMAVSDCRYHINPPTHSLAHYCCAWTRFPQVRVRKGPVRAGPTQGALGTGSCRRRLLGGRAWPRHVWSRGGVRVGSRQRTVSMTIYLIYIQQIVLLTPLFVDEGSQADRSICPSKI